MNQVVRLADIMANTEAEADTRRERVSPPLDAEHLRMLEAVLFAASEPLDELSLARSLPHGANIAGLLSELEEIYRNRGVNLIKVAGKWQFRTGGVNSYSGTLVAATATASATTWNHVVGTFDGGT